MNYKAYPEKCKAVFEVRITKNGWNADLSFRQTGVRFRLLFRLDKRAHF